MRRVVKSLIILFLLVMVPLKVNAASIKNASIKGDAGAKIGEELSFSIAINYNDIAKSGDSRLGIWLVITEIEFDEDVLAVSSVSASGFDSIVLKDEGKYYIYSEALENTSLKTSCVDDLLYCGDYLVNLKFFIKDTNLTTTTIKVKESGTALLNITDSNKTYTLDDAIEVETNIGKTHTITIKSNENKTVVTPPKSIVTSESKAKTETKSSSKSSSQKNTNSTNNKSQSKQKSSNALLKNIVVDGYELNFDKNKKEYVLNLIDSNNVLDIKVETEEENATYEIIGADDLKANNYKVIIDVTAEDSSKETYTIITKIDESESTGDFKDKIIDRLKGIDKKYYIYGGMMLGSLLLIGLVFFINRWKNDRKVNKLLKKL